MTTSSRGAAMSTVSIVRPDNAAAQPQALTAELVQERFTDALRVHVGKGKPWSVEALAEATGIDDRTIRGYHEGSACASMAKALALAAVLPPDFTNALLGLAGLGHAKRLEPGEVAVAELGSDLAGAVALLSRHLEDGVVDHQEREEGKRRLRPLAEKLAAFLDLPAPAAFRRKRVR